MQKCQMSPYAPIMRTLIQSAALPDFLAKHAMQEACLARIREVRWPQGFVCPHCCYAGGYALPERRGFECIECGRQTSVTSGMAFAIFKLPLPKVFLAMCLILANKQGISG